MAAEFIISILLALGTIIESSTYRTRGNIVNSRTKEKFLSSSIVVDVNALFQLCSKVTRYIVAYLFAYLFGRLMKEFNCSFCSI